MIIDDNVFLCVCVCVHSTHTHIRIHASKDATTHTHGHMCSDRPSSCFMSMGSSNLVELEDPLPSIHDIEANNFCIERENDTIAHV